MAPPSGHAPCPPRGALWDLQAGCAVEVAVLRHGVPAGKTPPSPQLRVPHQGALPALVPSSQLRTRSSHLRPHPAGLYTRPGCRGPCTALLGWGPRLPPWTGLVLAPELEIVILGRREGASNHPRPGLFPRAAVTLPLLPTESSPAGFPGGGAAESAWPSSGLLPPAEIPPAAGHAPGPQ